MLYIYIYICLKIRSYLSDEFDVFSFDVLDNHDALLSEEVQGEFVSGISENRLLNEQHICAGLDDLGHEVSDVLSFFLEDSVHGSVVLHNDGVLDFSFGRAQAELDQGDLGVLHTGGTTSGLRGLLVGEDETFDQFSVFDGATEFLDDLDVTEISVDVLVCIDDFQDGVDGDGAELLRVSGDDLWL